MRPSLRTFCESLVRGCIAKQLKAALLEGKLDKQECLVLRGRLGLADSFLHGRVGKLTLKKQIDHAYGISNVLDEELRKALQTVCVRLEQAKPKCVTAKCDCQQFFTVVCLH